MVSQVKQKNAVEKAQKVQKVQKTKKNKAIKYKKISMGSVFLFFQKCLKLILIFFISRTSLFFELNPFAPVIMLALGGDFFSFLSALLGAYTIESFEAVFYILTSFALKIFLKNEKFDLINIAVSGVIVYTSIITQNDFNPYDIILRFISILFSIGSYYPLKTACKAQFLKSKVLKFTKKEAYCSIFLLFAFLTGVNNTMIYHSLDFSNILKIYTVILCAAFFGAGTASATGAIIGILSASSSKNASFSMAYYSLMGLMTGIFAKFSKFTSILGLICTYIFSYAYMQDFFIGVTLNEIIISSVVFLFTPKKLLKEYFERYSETKNTQNMLSTVNSVAASRLDSLSKSFFSLSDKINIMPSKKEHLINLNTESMCDFLCEKVCSKCTLKNICWDKDRSFTIKTLQKTMNEFSKKEKITVSDFDSHFSGRCTKMEEVIFSLNGFYDILKVNSVWKRKMLENSKAFKQQFVEMSEIICDMKKSIETNKYYEAELSSDIYAAISYEGYIVKDVVVIKDATGSFFVKISLEHCFEKTNCLEKIKSIIEDVLGIYMVKCDGGCSDKICNLLFREGSVGKLEKRVYNISKNSQSPAGDSYIINRISPNKYLVALCDGMGSGKEASEISEYVTELLSNMLSAGFSEEATYKMINSFVISNLSGLGFTTMDFMVIDTKNMLAKIVKKGACPTYIKRNGKEVITVENKSLPAGIQWQKPYIKTFHIFKDDIIVMTSDGAFEAFPDKHWIKNILRKNISKDLNECIDLIYSLAQQDSDKKDDDITVLGIKIA